MQQNQITENNDIYWLDGRCSPSDSITSQQDWVGRKQGRKTPKVMGKDTDS